MTLCLIWRDDSTIHLASDSRLSFGSAGKADVAIKVGREPYSIRGPDQEGGAPGAVIVSGDLAFCFAGSGVGSVFMKESLSGVLNQLQVVPSWHDFSLRGVADLVFEVYQSVSKHMMAVLREDAFVALVIAGHCAVAGSYRAFLCEPQFGQVNADGLQAFGMREILCGTDHHVFIGSGKSRADAAVATLRSLPTGIQLMRILKTVIDDRAIDSVGGSIQYGRFDGATFSTKGILEITQGDDQDLATVHYWRGALDLREPCFEDKFSINYPLIPLSAFYP